MNAARVVGVLVVAGMLAVAWAGAAQEGDPSSGRGPGQEILYTTAATVAPIRIQTPNDFDPAQRYPLVVGLHGHGGRGDEFFTVAPRFAEADIIYAVLQAPYALAMAGRIGYSWNLRGVDDEAGDQGESELSIRYILSAVDTLVEKFSPESVYLIGFSQGGTMTYQTALANPDPFDGFAVFGSWYRPDWFTEEELAAANDLRVFIGHGLQDGVVERSTASRDILAAAGFDVTLYDYPGGHMIANSAIDEMFAWMGRR
jgi:phospholipase/carboxylesterase